MKVRLMVALLLLIVVQAFGIGAFRLTNGRNHPELKWKSIDTDNCRIIYHEPLAEIAKETARLSETTFLTLAKTYQLSPDKKCIIYISDQDNIPNGATVFSHYIFVWVNQHDFTSQFTGNEKWLRKVIAHEMSHWFVAASIEGYISVLLPIFPNFPRNLNEGYAQFFSGEPWGANRGDRFLKASILSAEEDIASPGYEGGLLYGSGFAMVKYLVAMHGEESLVKLLKFRGDTKLFSFGDAFRKVYKQSFSEFQEEFRRYMYTYYYGEVYANKSVPADTTAAGSINDFSELKSSYQDYKLLDWQNEQLLFVGKQSEKQGYYDLMLGTVAVDSLAKDKLVLKPVRRIFKGNFIKISLSENGKWVAFSVYSRHKRGRMAPRVYCYDVQNSKLRKFGEGNYPEIDNEGRIYFQRLGTETNDIMLMQQDGSISKWYSLGFNEQIGNIALSPDADKIALTVFDVSGAFRVEILTANKADSYAAITVPAMAQSLLWNGNNELIYTVENQQNYSMETLLYSMADNSVQSIGNNAYNSFPVKLHENKVYVLAEYKRGGKSLGSHNYSLAPQALSNFSGNHYNKWLKTKAINSIPAASDTLAISSAKSYHSLVNMKWRMGLAVPAWSYAGGAFALSEAMGKQLLVGVGAIPYSSQDRAWWALYYENNTLEPSLSAMYTRQQWLSGVGEEKLYYQDMDRLTLRAEFPVAISRAFSYANFGMGLSHNDLKNGNDNPIFEDKNFASMAANAGYGYNLPWQNAENHPVRHYYADYAIQAATDKLHMNMDFTQHSFRTGFAYAPLLERVKPEILRTVALENRSNFELVNGRQLKQFLPGIDSQEILQVNNQPAFKRYYLRGYEEDFLCRKIINIQTELNVKIADDLGIGFVSDAIAMHYTGISLWHDFTRLFDIQDAQDKYKSYQANGIELRVETSFLMIPATLKYGIAYDTGFHKLADYFLLEVPLLEMVQSK